MVTKYTFKRIFRKAVKHLTKAGLIFCLLFSICYFVNDVVYGKLIWDNAYKFQNSGDWRAAIDLYNNSIKYFSLTDFLKINREKYIEVQYRKALCYLGLGKEEEADKAIKQGMYLITDSYGVKSVEYAQYIRQYVIAYYLKKKDYNAVRNYLKLSEYLYSKLKTNNSAELAQINYLYGDMYMDKGRPEAAYLYYKNAYRIATTFEYTDFDTLIQTTKRMGDIDLLSGNNKQAVVVYSKLLDTLIKKKCSDKAKYAYVKWQLANAYAKEGKHETALDYYDEAYSIITKLPDKPEYYDLKQKQLNDIRLEMAKSYNAIGRYGSATKMQNEIQKS